MNYYEHHLGDYAEATAHLSFVEDAAYSRMIRKYYAQEKPLPADPKVVQRLIGARTKEEREAVDTVLGEFFVLEIDGHHNARCDAEIARYQDKQAKAKRSANARWNKPQQHTEGNADAMRTHESGSAKNEKKNSDQCAAEKNISPDGVDLDFKNSNKSKADAMRTHTEGNAHQAPSTRHQVNPIPQSAAFTEPEVGVTPSSPPLASPIGSDSITTRACELAGLLRQRGAALTATNPEVRRWAEEGVSDAQALQALEVAQQRRADKADPSAIPAGYLTPIIRDLRNQPPGGGARASPHETERHARRKWAEELTAVSGQGQGGQDDGRTIDV